MKAGAIGIKTKVIVGDAATLYLAEKIARQFGGGIPDAPIDGVLYARKNGNWVEVVVDEQIQSDLTETDVDSKAFIIGKDEFKAEILGDVVIPEPQFYFTENRQNLIFENGWIKVPFNFNVNQFFIKNITLYAVFGTGRKQLTCEVSYPSKNTYSSAVDWALYIKDADNILNENSDFSSIEFRFDLITDLVSKFNGKKFKLGNGVVFDENAAFHSTAGVATFDKVYPSFNGGKYETVLDPLTNYYSLEYDYTQTYCEIKDASIVSRPYLNASISENVASNPNILTVASHFGNSFERHDITNGANIFIQNVIAVGARRDSPTDHTGASSYGYGVEFIEVAGKQEMNDNYNGAGDIWFPAGGYNVYQQSPTCAIVSAKFRQIQDATKASWGICRKAARATASNSNSWNIYQGFGVINVAAAIQYIEDNYINNSEYRANLADKIAGENEKYSFVKYEDLDENSPLPKRESDLKYAPIIHDHAGQVINPDAVVLDKTYTDLQMIDLPIGSIFRNSDQNCWLLKLSDVNYYNFGEELPMLCKNGDASTHLEGTAVYITGGTGQFAVLQRTSSNIGKCNAIATADVLNTGSGQGYYCFFGSARKYPYANVIKSTDNAATWIEGASLYLCNELGKYSTVKEDAPSKSIKIGTITNRNGANITVMFTPEPCVSIDDLCDVDGNDTAIADTDELLKKDTAGLWKKVTWANVKLLLSGVFAKLSGGNDFLNTQNFDGRINHKAGEYFYTAASKTADAINDTRVINTAGVEIYSVCTGNGATKGGGTWVETMRITADGTMTIWRLRSNTDLYAQALGGWLYQYGRDGSLIETSEGEVIRFLKNRNINFLAGKYHFHAASPSSDTINDTRTSNSSGVKIEEICTAVLAGGANVKGSGTWKKNSGISEIGGQMIALRNKTGAASVKGTVVSLSDTTDDSFKLQSSEFDAVGVVYESGIADGSECWVVISGKAQVLLTDGTASTRGYWVYADAVDGRANASVAIPAGGTIQELQNHFKEIGHCLESKTAGTNVLAKCVLHFN